MNDARRVRAAVLGTGAAGAAWACAVRVAEARALVPIADEEAHRLARRLPDLPWGALGGDFVGRVYQEGLGAAQRRHSGVHYTPREAADYLVARAWEGGPLVDLACGAGAFLLAAARTNRDLGAVVGFDLDPVAVALAVEALALDTGRGDAEGARRFWRERVHVADGLRVVAGPARAVVGNPPFFAATGREELQAFARERFPDVYSGRNDVSHFFVARALELLEGGGRLGLVLPAYFLENTFAAALRGTLAERTGLVELVDLRDVRLFGAQVHAVLLVAEKGGRGGGARLRAPAGRRTGDVLADLTRLGRGEPPRVLHPAPAPPEALLSRMASHPSLASLCRIEKGCETGRNEVFVVEKGRARELGLEAGALRPLVKGRHVAPFRVTPADEVLLYLDGRTPIETWPRVHAYLEGHRVTLLSRAECRDGVYPWWRLHRPRGRELGEARVKIVAPYRAARPAFAVDRRGALNDGGDIRFLLPHEGIDPDYLCGVLNSASVAEWLAWRGKRKGELFELFLEPLARIPVPSPVVPEAVRIAALARAAAEGADVQGDLDALVRAAYDAGG